MLVLSNNVCGVYRWCVYLRVLCLHSQRDCYLHLQWDCCLSHSQRDCCLLTLSAVCLSDAESGAYFFVVIEMVFHSFDFLIGFVSFSCNEDDIAGLHQCGGGANGFAAVGDGECFSASCFV